MNSNLQRPAGFVCHLCRLSSASQARLRQSSILHHAQKRWMTGELKFPISQTKCSPGIRSRQISNTQKSAQTATLRPSQHAQAKVAKRPSVARTERRDFELPNVIVAQAQKIMASTGVPDQVELLTLLSKCSEFAKFLILGKPSAKVATTKHTADGKSATASLLELDEAALSQSAQVPLKTREQAAESLSNLVFDVISDKKVFISIPVLTSYVSIQSTLGKPEYIPEIFYLFAHKSVPVPGSSNPIQYRPPPPAWSPKNAIPKNLADQALEVAIEKKDMSTAISIISSTTSLTAHRWHRFLYRAGPGLLLYSTIFPTFWAASSWLAENWQITMDVDYARRVFFAASMGYVGTCSMLGYMALTGWGDHHNRVVWAPGTKQWERWIREDERAMFDRVACAWGFKEKAKRGEEQGDEWEALRELIGLRQMQLDRTDLLEGMQ